MVIEVRVPEYFLHKVKQLRKKYPTVDASVDHVMAALQNGERPGDKIPGVGYDVYKVRLPNPSAGRGKSGGFRVIYYVQLADRVLLLNI